MSDPGLTGSSRRKGNPVSNEASALLGAQHGGAGDTVEALEDLLEAVGIGRFQWMLVAMCSFGYFAFCAELLVSVFVQTSVMDLFDLTVTDYALWSSLTVITSCTGNVVWGTASDKWGRRWPFFLTLLCSGAFGFASAFAPTYALLLAGRCLCTFGSGGIVTIDFPLCLEYLPSRGRGRPMTVITVGGSLGVLACAAAAWIIIPGGSANAWRWFMASTAVPSLLCSVARLFSAEETPRFLLTAGRFDEFRKVMTVVGETNKADMAVVSRAVDVAIACAKGNANGPHGKAQVQAVDLEETAAVGAAVFVERAEGDRPAGRTAMAYVRALFGREHRRSTLLVMTMWVFTTLNYFGLATFLPQYYLSININLYASFMASVVAQLPGVALVTWMVERPRFGRIWSLRLFNLGATISYLGMGLFAAFGIDAAVIAFAAAGYFFIVPVYAVLYTYTPELYPTDLRSTATATFFFAISATQIVLPYLSGFLVEVNIDWLYPAVWGACCGVSTLASVFLVKETVGIQLADVSK